MPATTRVVVAAFENPNAARQAIDELHRLGFTDRQIGVVARHTEHHAPTAPAGDEGSHAAAGAVTGVVAGAGVGGLWAIGIMAGLLPAIGPVIAGGILASLAASAATGAAAGGILGALLGVGVPEDDAKFYEDQFHAGRAVVTVQAGDRADEVSAVLRQHGAYDIDNPGESAAVMPSDIDPGELDHSATAGMPTTAAAPTRTAVPSPTGTLPTPATRPSV